MTRFTLDDVRERTYKQRDAWWTVFLVDPLAGRLVVATANRTSLTPNQLTVGAGLFGLGSAICFAMATWPWLVAGALLFHLSFVLDCMDGKIARLKGTGTVFGAWVDFVFDRIRFFGCMLALMIGQWLHTGEIVYLLLAPVATFVDLLRYLNGPQMGKTRATMRTRLAEAEATGTVTVQDTDPEAIEAAPMAGDEGDEGDSAAQPAQSKGRLARMSAALRRHRVRMHLFSGIEFEMFVCVVAPLTAVVSLFTPLDSLIVAVVVLSCAALLVFEAALVARLWAETRRFEKKIRTY
ncbi:CDP-alcohol phosphatidyltransferase family protein [Nocardiopsis ansamitocini]|uniref:CDP-alcohol phosphatidyltransferase n=1 Tax=Nocardiopsis ansamitocini TaxID=1670832 RepID=A0A9W6UKU6_9ACTN|nr:CDP-alcohol phosphatidyltransferase family protein [Nocardiopsis ansamitocini]GLU50359.1 hypothetical protein Nans01_47100 [Nocardiopsis ansamitocini]